MPPSQPKLRISSWVTKGDIVLLGIALAILSGVFMTFWQRDGHGAEVVVYVEGKRWARLNLFHNQELHVPGMLGNSHIRVLDGQVRFIDSPCPNKLCVHVGWLSQGGENATCLPNRVSVQILASDPRFDSINF
ncbi:MAG: NusG domain II-containing protein [Gammaproteobacteria bacterium]